MSHEVKNYSQARPILQCDLLGNTLSVYLGFIDAANAIGKPQGDTNICRCCKGRTKTAYGYVWKYAEIKETDYVTKS